MALLGRRTLKFVLALILAVLVPSRAYASTLVGSYDIPQEADAVACDFLGYDYDTMDSGLKALLHSSTVGGGSGTDSNPNFAGYAAFRDSLYSPALMGDYQWYSRYDGFMFVDAVDKARSDAAGAVRWWEQYGGDDGGSGGESGLSGSYIYLTNAVGNVRKGEYSYESTSYQSASGYNVRLLLSQTQINYLENNNLSYRAYVYNIGNNSSRNIALNAYIVVSSDTITENITENSGNPVPYYYLSVTNLSGYYFKNTSYINANGPTVDNDGYVTISMENQSLTGNSSMSVTNATAYWSMGSSGGGSSQPEGGPVPEPTPTQPQVPSGPTFSPTINIDNGSSGTVDLSPITERLDVMNQNFIDFAESFHEYWEWWADMMTDLDGQLKRMASDINTWLQMIYNKMRSGNSPNPVTQPDGWDEWFGKLLDELVDRLLDMLPLGAAELLAELARLRAVFPFSIPWDIGLMLGLLRAEPVTPVFDIPFPYAWANGAAVQANVHIDLTPWDGVAYGIRRMLFMISALGLALNTKKLFRNVEVD